jgi:hypothetical protein
MGIVEGAVGDLSGWRKAGAIAAAYGAGIAALPLRLLPRRRLTDTYLRDPAVVRADEEQSRGDGPLHIVRQ